MNHCGSLAQIVALSTSKDEGDPSNAPFKAALARLLMPRPRTGGLAMALGLSMTLSDFVVSRHRPCTGQADLCDLVV